MEIEKYLIATDQQLVEMSLNGDTNAFEHLFNRYRESIYLLHMQQTGGNLDDTNDLLQESFIKVFLNLDKYNPNYTFGQWVYTIARNTFIDFIRKQRENISLDSMDESYSPYTPTARTPNPEESIISAQHRTQIEDHLQKMRPRYRQLIELRFIKGYSYEEIAEELDAPLGTIKTQIHRAREQLCKFIIKHSDILP